jgi:hypothetical protein
MEFTWSAAFLHLRLSHGLCPFGRQEELHLKLHLCAVQVCATSNVVVVVVVVIVVVFVVFVVVVIVVVLFVVVVIVVVAVVVVVANLI